MITTHGNDVAVFSPDYALLLDELKERIRTSQVKAMLSVNAALIRLYGDIGGSILQKQREEGWGTKVIEQFYAGGWGGYRRCGQDDLNIHRVASTRT